jgi:hypothetical protein
MAKFPHSGKAVSQAVAKLSNSVDRIGSSKLQQTLYFYDYPASLQSETYAFAIRAVPKVGAPVRGATRKSK